MSAVAAMSERPSRYFRIASVSPSSAPRSPRSATRFTVTSRSIRPLTRTPPRTLASGFGEPLTYCCTLVLRKVAGASARPFSERSVFFALASFLSSSCCCSSSSFHTELNCAAACSGSTSQARMIERTSRGRFSPVSPRESQTPNTSDVGARTQSGPASPRWSASKAGFTSFRRDGEDCTTASAARCARSSSERVMTTSRGCLHLLLSLHPSHSLHFSFLATTISICGTSQSSGFCDSDLKIGSIRFACEPTLSIVATRVPSESVSML